jgi:hypothetical protein
VHSGHEKASLEHPPTSLDRSCRFVFPPSNGFILGKVATNGCLYGSQKSGDGELILEHFDFKSHHAVERT